MKTIIKTIAIAAIAIMATACSNEAERIAPDTGIANKAIEAPDRGRDDMNIAQAYAMDETYYAQGFSEAEIRSYVIEINTETSTPDQLVISGLAGNHEITVIARAQDDGSFTIAEALENVPGMEGPVRINGAGSIDRKQIRISYTMQTIEGEMQAEATGEAQ